MLDLPGATQLVICGLGLLPDRDPDLLLSGLNMHDVAGRLPLQAGHKLSYIDIVTVQRLEKAFGRSQGDPNLYLLIGIIHVNTERIAPLENSDMLVRFRDLDKLGVWEIFQLT